MTKEIYHSLVARADRAARCPPSCVWQVNIFMWLGWVSCPSPSSRGRLARCVSTSMMALCFLRCTVDDAFALSQVGKHLTNLRPNQRIFACVILLSGLRAKHPLPTPVSKSFPETRRMDETCSIPRVVPRAIGKGNTEMLILVPLCIRSRHSFVIVVSGCNFPVAVLEECEQPCDNHVRGMIHCTRPKRKRPLRRVFRVIHRMQKTT